MILVVIISHKCNINPDNVATPSECRRFEFLAFSSSPMLIPFWSWLANRNKYTKQVLYAGWTPVVWAMAISSFGGYILDFAMSRFKGIAVFQPVINGKEKCCTIVFLLNPGLTMLIAVS